MTFVLEISWRSRLWDRPSECPVSDRTTPYRAPTNRPIPEECRSMFCTKSRYSYYIKWLMITFLKEWLEMLLTNIVLKLLVVCDVLSTPNIFILSYYWYNIYKAERSIHRKTAFFFKTSQFFKKKLCLEVLLIYVILKLLVPLN